MGFGRSVWGASNVLTVSTLGAVSVSPAADLALMPARVTSISTGSLGSTLVSSSQNFPALSLAAIASTRGKVILSCVYVPASKDTGTSVASWNGKYILPSSSLGVSTILTLSVIIIACRP